MFPADVWWSYLFASLLVIAMGVPFVFWTGKWDEAIRTSIIVGLVSIFGAFTWTQDWWMPPTITGTAVGIEDFLLGVGFALVGGLSHELLFPSREKVGYVTWKEILGLTALFAVPYLVSFIFLPSYIAYYIAILFPITWLILNGDRQTHAMMAFSALALLLTTIAMFGVLSFVFTDFYATWYYDKNLTGITFVGGPMIDYLWAITTGMVLGPMWHVLEDQVIV